MHGIKLQSFDSSCLVLRTCPNLDMAHVCRDDLDLQEVLEAGQHVNVRVLSANRGCMMLSMLPAAPLAVKHSKKLVILQVVHVAFDFFS